MIEEISCCVLCRLVLVSMVWFKPATLIYVVICLLNVASDPMYLFVLIMVTSPKFVRSNYLYIANTILYLELYRTDVGYDNYNRRFIDDK